MKHIPQKLRFALIILLILSWTLAGLPRLFEWVGIRHGVEVAHAAVDLTWNTGAADFEIWASSSLTWDAGTLKCSATLTDDNASTVSCSSGTIQASTQYRVQVVLKESGTTNANMAGTESVLHKNVKAGWAGTNPTLDTCGVNDLGSDDTNSLCNLDWSGNDVSITAGFGTTFKLAGSGGQEGFMYLITTDTDAATSSTSYFDTTIDANSEDSSKITITQGAAFAYEASGNLVSSSIDTDSYSTIRNKNALRTVWTQNVPTGCTLTVALSGTNTGPTPDYSTSTWTSEYSGSGTTVIQDLSGVSAVQGKRFFRYRVSMTNCSSNTKTPILSDIYIDLD